VELQISSSKGDALVAKAPALPQQEELERFADEARNTLHNLSFSQKRAILVNTVERIVGTPRQLRIYGSIPIKNHVEFRTEHRHRLYAPRHAATHRVPFEFQIKLPPPLRKGVDYGFMPGTNISAGASRLP
jgi:site-specific DNA recombinase